MSTFIKSGWWNSLHDNTSPMEVMNIKISKTKKCRTEKIRRVYTPKWIQTENLLEQSTMDRIRRKVGTKFQSGAGREGDQTIPTNHIYFIVRDSLSDKGNNLAADWCTELEHWANLFAPYLPRKQMLKKHYFTLDESVKLYWHKDFASDILDIHDLCGLAVHKSQLERNNHLSISLPIRNQ